MDKVWLSLVAALVILTSGCVAPSVPKTPHAGPSGASGVSGASGEAGAVTSAYVSTPLALTAAWANEGGDKVAREELRASGGASVTNSAWDGTRIKLFGARNEVVAFDLVLEAARAQASAVRVAFNALSGPSGARIASVSRSGDGIFDWTQRNIELFYLRYLPVKGLSHLSYDTYDERHVPRRFRRPWTGAGYGTGLWTDRADHDRSYPDIAVPHELVPTFTVGPGQSQSVWADVYIPKSAPAGKYTGTVSVFEGTHLSYSIPVELTVRNFALPDVPSAKTMVHLGYADIAHRYTGVRYPNPNTPEDAETSLVRDRHFQLAHRHKISLIDTNDGATAWSQDAPRPEWLPRLTGALFTAGHGYDGPGVATSNNVFSIGTYGSWSWQSQGESGMWDHANGWVSWFDTNAPGVETFLYLIDETSNYAQLEQWASWMKSNPGVGRLLRSMATIWLPTAQASAPDLDIAASWMAVGDTPTWDSAVAAQHAAGKLVYFYNGKRPASGSFATEDDGVALRELAWGQYKKKIDRWFYWTSTNYYDYQSGRGENNLFHDAQTFGAKSGVDPILGETGWNHSNGDGVLFYPGTDKVFPADSYNVGGPLASLRLKLWRRGIQDVDYLKLAEAVDPTRVRDIVGRLLPEAMWEYGVSSPSDPTWVRSDISWSTNPDDWEAARAELADIIEGTR